MKETIYLSYQLKKLDFFLFNIIKRNLGEDYLITTEDINFLLEINSVINIRVFEELGLGKYILKLFKENPDLLKGQYDPYELFIDAGFLDSKLNVIC